MANEINIQLDPVTQTGLTVSAQVRTTAGTLAETVALAEIGSTAYYTGSIVGPLGAGVYYVAFLDSGELVGSGELYWDGSAEVDVTTLDADIAAAPTATANATAVRSELAAELARLDVAVSTRSSHGAPDLTNLDATVSSRLASAGYTAPLDSIATQAAAAAAITAAEPLTVDAAGLATSAEIAALNDPSASDNAAAVRSELAAELARLDVAVSTRSSHGAPDLTNLDATVSSRLASASYTAPLGSTATQAAASAAIAAAEPLTIDAAGLATSAEIAALNDPTAAQNATAVRSELAAELARLDVAVSTRSSHGAPDLTNLDATVSSRQSELDAASRAATDVAEHDATQLAIAGISAGGAPTAEQNATAVRSELAPELARLDVAVSTRSSHGAPDLSNLDAAVSSRQSELDAASRAAADIAEHDTTQLAIAGVGAAPSAGAIADAVRLELAPELALIDVAISTRLASASYAAPLDATATQAAASAAIAAYGPATPGDVPTAAQNAAQARLELSPELGRIDVDMSSREALGASAAALASVGLDAPTVAIILAAARTTENRLEIDFGAQQLVAYADDGVTVRRRWTLATEAGEPVAAVFGSQTKRTPV